MKLSQYIPEHIFFALRIFLPPFLTLILAKILFELLAFDFLELNQIPVPRTSGVSKISTEITLNEFKARLLWLTSVLAYFFIMAGFGTFIWSTLKTSVTKSTLMFFVIVASTMTAIEAIYILNVVSSESPIASIFRFTFDAHIASGLFTAEQLFIIHTTLDAINFISFLVVPFGILAGCCIMHDVPLNVHKGADYFLERSSQLKKLTTGASAVMVIGIIHMQLWLNWPLSFQDQTENMTQLGSVLRLICQYWGVSYTMITAALYIPAASYLRDQAKLAILHGNDEQLKKNPSKWLIENNMMFSLTASLPQIIAVIAPMLVGSFGSTLSELRFF